jgi:hypothetical protein
VVLEEKDRRRLIDQRFQSSFGAEGEMEIEAAFKAKQPDESQGSNERERFLEAERERRLVVETPIKDSALIELARGRAAVIQSRLTTVGGVEAERIFVLDPDVISDDSDAPQGARIALTAR